LAHNGHWAGVEKRLNRDLKNRFGGRHARQSFLFEKPEYLQRFHLIAPAFEGSNEATNVAAHETTEAPGLCRMTVTFGEGAPREMTPMRHNPCGKTQR
jgi:hypothetical protein